jgi:hypothetical protein
MDVFLDVARVGAREPSRGSGRHGAPQETVSASVWVLTRMPA